MARLFDDASEEYLYVNQAIVTVPPFAFACFIHSDDLAVNQPAMSVGDKDTTEYVSHLYLRGADAGDYLWAFSHDYDGGSADKAITTSGVSVNTWHHGAAVWLGGAGSIEKHVYIDGGSKGSDTNASTMSQHDCFKIATNADGTTNVWFSGRIAEAAVWDLTDWGANDAERETAFETALAQLAAGYPPSDYPTGLLAYWPLIDDDDDYAGSFDLTPVNTPSWAAHPPMIIRVFPATLELETTLQTSSLVISSTITPSALDIALALQTPTVYDIITVTPDELQLALIQQTPTVFDIQTVLPSVLTLALTLQTSSLVIDTTITPSVLALALTLETPITINIHLPGSFPMALSLLVPSIIVDFTSTPSAFALALIQQTPTVFDIQTVLPSVLTMGVALPVPVIDIFYIAIPPFMHEDLITPYSGGVWLWLVKIVVPTQVTQRIAKNNEAVIYGSVNFPKGSFELGKQILTGDASVPRIQLRVAQGRDRILEDIINATKGGEDGTVTIIRTCEKYTDTPVQSLEAVYDILTAGSDFQWVTFILGMPNPLMQRIPLWSYSSKVCELATPSLFKGPRCQYAGSDTVCTGLYEDCYTKGNAEHWGAEIGLDANAVRV